MVEAHPDPVHAGVTRPVGGIRIVVGVQDVIAVRVERSGSRAAGLRLVSATGVRIARALVGRPEHRGGRCAGMHGVGHEAECRDVGSRVLAPRIPRTVHLVREPDDRGHAVGAVSGQPAGEVRGRPGGHRRETAPRLEGRDEDGARVAGLVGSRVEVLRVRRREREGDEAHDGGRRVAEAARHVRDRLGAPVDVHPHPHAVRGSPARERAQAGGRDHGAWTRDRRGGGGVAAGDTGASVTPGWPVEHAANSSASTTPNRLRGPARRHRITMASQARGRRAQGAAPGGGWWRWGRVELPVRNP